MVAIPQSGLLAQVGSLRLPLGHSGLVLTLRNAACASLPSPCLQASVLLLRWGCYRWTLNLCGLIIYLFFLPVMFPFLVPRLTTDSGARVFPRV